MKTFWAHVGMGDHVNSSYFFRESEAGIPACYLESEAGIPACYFESGAGIPAC